MEFSNAKEVPTSRFGLTAIWAEGRSLIRMNRGEVAQQLLRQAIDSVRAAPLTSLLTLITITIVLSLVGIFIVLVENLSGSVAASQQSLALRFYLAETATESQVGTLSSELRANPAIDAVRLVTKPEALQEFREALGEQGALLEGVAAQNPLPASLEVRLKDTDSFEQEVEALAQQYTGHAAVEHVQYSQTLLGQLGKLLERVKFGGRLTLILLLSVSGFVIAVAIRLALYGHRQEIQIMRLVGSADTLIGAPFLIEGFFQGIVGSLGALAAVYLVYSSVQQTVGSDAALSGFFSEPAFLSPVAICSLVFSGPIVGLVGSYLAVQRFRDE